MPRVPFPNGLEGSENLPRTSRLLQNCFVTDKGDLIGRPGITELSTTGKTARGQFEWSGSLYQVVSQSLIKITDKATGAFSIIGTIAGSQSIRTAIGFNNAVILAQGGNLYTLDSSDTLVDITGNANFVSCDDVTHINGRFVYIPTSGDPAFFSDVGAAGTVQVTSFFDAEELPDKNSAVFNLNNTLGIMGTDSIEFFRDTGASPNPFLRVTGSRISNGFIGGLLEYKDTFVYIGKETGQDYGLYVVSQGRSVKISNEAIDLMLSTYTITELGETVASRFKWRGHDIATFTLRRDSFAFLNGQWFVLDTIFNGVSSPWGGGYITQFEGEYFTAFEGKIGKFAKVNTDYGERITRIIETTIENLEGEWFACQSIELGIAQGANASIGSVALQVSQDNVQFGPSMYRTLGNLGQYQRRLIWNYSGGLGRYRGFMGYRIITTEDVDFSADYMIADVEIDA